MTPRAFLAPLLLAPLLLALCLTPALAQVGGRDALYLDNRSTPAAVVRSLYSAVNREEYARAYGYWQAGAKGLPPYKRFVAGYRDTALVALSLGRVVSEGAAGSIYSTVPVHFQVVLRSGRKQIFEGCYVLRQIQPALQEPPFRPISIVSGTLHEAGPTSPGHESKPGRALCSGVT